MSRNIYVASSWRNGFQPFVVNALREAGHTTYDFRNPAPGNTGFRWSEISPNYVRWNEKTYLNALQHAVAQEGFAHDWDAMEAADTCVLVCPSGRSAHIEAGYFVGHPDKQLYIFMPVMQEPELMYKMANGIYLKLSGLIEALA